MCADRETLHDALDRVLDEEDAQMRAGAALALLRQVLGDKGREALVGGAPTGTNDLPRAITMRAVELLNEVAGSGFGTDQSYAFGKELGQVWRDIWSLQYRPQNATPDWMRATGSTEKFDSMKQQYEDAACGYLAFALREASHGEKAGVRKRIAACYRVSTRTLRRWSDALSGAMPADKNRAAVYEKALCGQCSIGPLTVFHDEGVGVFDFAQAEGLQYRTLMSAK
ncbi:MAG: hypothetical protein ACSHW2_12180 [Parasphingopyxis sp.]